MTGLEFEERELMTHCPLVSSDWLADHLSDPQLRLIDASWHMPAANRDAHKEYLDAHIGAAVFFDIDLYAAPSDLPHMMPSATQFSSFAGVLGIAQTDTIVVYDTSGLFSAPRVWWMFKMFGAQKVYVLDGGLAKWMDEGRLVESGSVDHQPSVFKAKLVANTIVSAEQVLESVTSGADQIYDARSQARFSGEQQEARTGLRSGHIPGTVNLPFADLLDEGRLKPRDKLLEVFAALDFDPAKPVITTCGSGITAAVIHLALECIGYRDARIYDGSWTDWGARDDLPVATGL